MSLVRVRAAVLIAATFVLALTIMTDCRGQDRPSTEREQSGAITPAEAKRKVDEITRNLKEARELAARIGDKALRDRIEGLLSRSELQARDLSDELARARPAQPRVLIALPEKEFSKLLKGLQAEPYDKDKLIYIENFASKVPLSCQQAAALLKCFAFDNLRIEALKPIYKVLVDPHNLNDVLAVYAYSQSKAQARQSVGLK